MNTDGIFEIALFPIPGCVSFPQTVVPLHVFEPRYRQMIQECVASRKLLGVCHTKSLERFAPRISGEAADQKDLESLYKQNLSTFKPQDIFSAGTVEITETTEDGRYAINVNMLKRFRIIELIQTDPYKIAKCEEYSDIETVDFKDTDEDITEQRDDVISFLSQQLSKVGFNDEVHLNDIIQEPLVNKFTFKLFRYMRMDERQMQSILNLKDPLERLDTVHRLISHNPLQ